MLAVLFLVLVTLVLLGCTIKSVRRDARWMGNSFLVILSLLAVMTMLTLTAGPAAPLLFQLEVGVLLLSPLLVLVLAGLLLRNGMQMIRKEGRSLGNLLSLLAGVGLIGLELLAISVFVVQNTRYSALALFVMLASAYLGLELVAFLLYSFVYSRVVRRRRVDYVIALGAGLKDGRTVTPLLAGRVDRAIEVYREQRAAGVEAKLVMSGGKGSDEKVPEAVAMREHALTRGVPAEDVLTEERSTNTEQNLLCSREVMAADFAPVGADAGSPQLPCAAEPPAVESGRVESGREESMPSNADDASRPDAAVEPATSGREPRAMIVTSDYHAMRAATLARQLDIPADAVGARTARYYWPSAVLREFIAMLAQHKKRHITLMALFCLPLPILVAVN